MWAKEPMSDERRRQRSRDPPERAVRVRIFVNLAFEILEQQEIAFTSRNRIGRELDLAAAAGRIDAEYRRGIAGGMAAERPDDLQPLVHPGAEMRRAGNGIALIEVIGLDPVLEQAMHQADHGLRRVVDTLEQ